MPEVREASYKLPLCIFLCRDCHDKAPRMEQKLWKILFDTFGEESVRLAVSVLLLMTDTVVVNLPEET